jgi:hypothetical protein
MNDPQPFEGLMLVVVALGLAVLALRACGWMLTGR